MNKVQAKSIDREPPQSRFIGINIPLSLHKRLRVSAAIDDKSLGGFLREALIERLDRIQQDG